MKDAITDVPLAVLEKWLPDLSKFEVVVPTLPNPTTTSTQARNRKREFQIISTKSQTKTKS